MEIARIEVSGAMARVRYRDPIPAGLVGGTVTVDYSDDIWTGLTKTVVFKGAETRDVVSNEAAVTIPHETVAEPGRRLYVGFYGTDKDGALVIPTIWADLGMIRDATDPSGDVSTDPSLPVYAQLAQQIGDLRDQVESMSPGGPGVGTGGGQDGFSPIASVEQTEDGAVITITDKTGTTTAVVQNGLDGDDGGHYTPTVTQPNGTSMQIGFTPSKPDMPTVQPVQITLPVNPDYGGNVELDTTLTQSGKAADAKAVGDALGKKLSADKLPEAVNNALAQAKASGEFKGDPGEPGQPGAPGEPGDDYVLTPADKTEIAEMAAELVDVPESSGGGIAVTGAKVGQTVKISAVDENGVPTAWTAVDFPSGGSSGGDNAFKFLGSTEPTTELVNRIDLSIKEDGITEIIVRGVAKQGDDLADGYLCIYINNEIASGNAKIVSSYESIFHYQGMLAGGNRCFYNLRASQWGNGALNNELCDWTNNYGEQVKTVGLQQSYWKNFALGAYFEVWGR